MLRVCLLAISAFLLIVQAEASSGQLPVRPNGLNNPATSEMRRAPQLTATVTQRQAIDLARARFSGNILRITLVGEGPNQRWQIRMENQGKVFTVFVHALTGRVTGGG